MFVLIDVGWVVSEFIIVFKKVGKYEYIYGYYFVIVNKKIK